MIYKTNIHDIRTGFGVEGPVYAPNKHPANNNPSSHARLMSRFNVGAITNTGENYHPHTTSYHHQEKQNKIPRKPSDHITAKKHDMHPLDVAPLRHKHNTVNSKIAKPNSMSANLGVLKNFLHQIKVLLDNVTGGKAQSLGGSFCNLF